MGMSCNCRSGECGECSLRLVASEACELPGTDAADIHCDGFAPARQA